jgi:hypothetical protein
MMIESVFDVGSRIEHTNNQLLQSLSKHYEAWFS